MLATHVYTKPEIVSCLLLKEFPISAQELNLKFLQF